MVPRPGGAGLLTFFVVTYLVAWGFFFAGGMTPPAWPRGLLFLPGTFAPGFVALWLTSRETGRGGVAALLRRPFDWQGPARWVTVPACYISAPSPPPPPAIRAPPA